jgi:hypothetical protein
MQAAGPGTKVTSEASMDVGNFCRDDYVLFS